jgi:GTPase SAR1 family protein
MEEAFTKTQYRHRTSQLIQIVNDLRDAGADNLEIDLPCVAACGNQSAGKSSLLERICGIQLPRASGTCTKCPMEVRMSSAYSNQASGLPAAMPWSCQVKLRQDFDVNGTPLEKPRETHFVSLTAAEKDQLAHYIRGAQKALLNPGNDVKQFLKAAQKNAAAAVTDEDAVADDHPERGDTLKFTRNVVVIDIKGAPVDLTLIDLPGIIQADEDNPDNVDLVANLVTDYIKRDRTIIVATVSCKDDVDNQVGNRCAFGC